MSLRKAPQPSNAKPPLSLTLHDDLPEAAGRVVDAGLEAANAAAAPLGDVRRLSCLARTPSGQVVGGGVGRTWGLCCELQQLWVHPDYRRQGVGGRIVKEFERHALARGCRTFYLETFSFQAPAFYQALGYQIRCELRGFAPGTVKYLMVREADLDEVDG
jgi:GNAT superfamily N-acetyltransferase